ncbi:MAG: D-alanyl-D-alanine carboxypeptidase [Pyrinomonadaceae bacterium]
MLIETLDRRKIMASLNPDAVYNPASITKLATTLAALKNLGADYRFETRVFAEGEIDKAGTLRGALHVSGADPTFGDMAAALIAGELKVRGIKRKVRRRNSECPLISLLILRMQRNLPHRLAKSLRLGPVKALVAEADPQSEPLFISEVKQLERCVALHERTLQQLCGEDEEVRTIGGWAGGRARLSGEGCGYYCGSGLAGVQPSGLGRNRMSAARHRHCCCVRSIRRPRVRA